MEMKRAILSVLVLLALGGTVHADDELPFPEGWRQVSDADLEASRKLEGYVQPTGQRLATCGDITGDGQVDCVRYLINIEDEETSIIMSVGGMPVEDVAWGTVLYRNAVERGIGVKLNLWDEPVLR